MGNRCTIKSKGDATQVYLHWNGGRDSVRAFLKYCDLRGFRGFSDSYGKARFCQIVGNFFGGGLSIGVGQKLDADNGDNGQYIVKGWKIVGREFFDGIEQNEYELRRMLHSINIKQPECERLPDCVINNRPILIGKVKIGDVLYVRNYENFEKFTVMGFGADEIVNGTNVLGLPFVNRYGQNRHNINNYIQHGQKVWKEKRGQQCDMILTNF